MTSMAKVDLICKPICFSKLAGPVPHVTLLRCIYCLELLLELSLNLLNKIVEPLVGGLGATLMFFETGFFIVTLNTCIYVIVYLAFLH